MQSSKPETQINRQSEQTNHNSEIEFVIKKSPRKQKSRIGLRMRNENTQYNIVYVVGIQNHFQLYIYIYLCVFSFFSHMGY